jgi:glycosyltransferase involved in cell wall biosynthesis
MSLFYDVTKTSGSRQSSGLIRVSERLGQALEENLGAAFVPVVWRQGKRCFTELSRRVPVQMSGSDHFLTPEVFSAEERSGYFAHLEQSEVQRAAVFHDAIPLKYPEITWPKSVSRHPSYMTDLARLNQIFSVSQASQDDLIDFWDERKTLSLPQLSTIALGADFFDRSTIRWTHAPQSVPLIVRIGIIEPRKNQKELLEVACQLWDAGLKFELIFVGRVNPHFGKPIEKLIKRAKKSGYPVQLISKQSDERLLNLYTKAHFTVFNSITEGFGLPVVESLWLGLPCISSRLPSLSTYFDQTTCISVESQADLQSAMTRWLTHPEELDNATSAARQLTLPTWRGAAETILSWMNSD